MTLVKHHPVDLAYRTKTVKVSEEVFCSYRLGGYEHKSSIDIVAPLALDARRDGKSYRTTEHVLLQSQQRHDHDRRSTKLVRGRKDE
jgi:hypothetical protein